MAFSAWHLIEKYAVDVIHGDIRPDNVLIFANQSGGYTPREADFGYSTMALNLEKGRVHFPRSKPWNVFRGHRLGDYIHFCGRKTGPHCSVFGFFFEDLPQLGEFLRSLDINLQAQDDGGLHWLQRLKEERKQLDFARGQIEEIGESDPLQKLGFTFFSQWVLMESSKERRLDFSQMADAQAIYHQQILAGNEESSSMDRYLELPEISGLNFLYLDRRNF